MRAFGRSNLWAKDQQLFLARRCTATESSKFFESLMTIGHELFYLQWRQTV